MANTSGAEVGFYERGGEGGSGDMLQRKIATVWILKIIRNLHCISSLFNFLLRGLQPPQPLTGILPCTIKPPVSGQPCRYVAKSQLPTNFTRFGCSGLTRSVIP